MRDHRGVACAFGHFNGGKSLGQRADLVHFDQDGISNPFGDAFAQNFGIGHEQIISHQLDFFAQFLRQCCPTVPIIFGHAVFN